MINPVSYMVTDGHGNTYTQGQIDHPESEHRIDEIAQRLADRAMRTVYLLINGASERAIDPSLDALDKSVRTRCLTRPWSHVRVARQVRCQKNHSGNCFLARDSVGSWQCLGCNTTYPVSSVLAMQAEARATSVEGEATARFFTRVPGARPRAETLRVLVDGDGGVAVWDDVAGHFTTCHSLSPRVMRRIEREVRGL